MKHQVTPQLMDVLPSNNRNAGNNTFTVRSFGRNNSTLPATQSDERYPQLKSGDRLLESFYRGYYQ